MRKNDKIFVAGHRGLVGSAILRLLRQRGYRNIISRTRQELNLLDQEAVSSFFKREKLDYVFLAAAKVGGIWANNRYPAAFIFENLQIQNNIIHQSYCSEVKKLLLLGSSCIYPKLSPQPIKEEYLLTGPLESTNEAYAVAKIAGIKMCQSYHQQYGTNFISLMPTNLYGSNDNFDLENSHVLPALIRKFYEARAKRTPAVSLWGTGKPKREFLHVDDLADACLFLMKNYNDPEIINVGTGEDISIKKLAELIQRIVGYEGGIGWDKTKPDGTPRKLLDVSKIEGLGWRHSISLANGIKSTYEHYLKQQ